jgi:hypothetical protein
MLPEQLSSQRSREPICLEWSSVHSRLNGRLIFHHNGNLGIVGAKLRSVVEICRATNYNAIIRNENLQVVSKGRLPKSVSF